MGGGPTHFNTPPLREAELDGTQAIADAIAPDVDQTTFFFNGMKIVLDPNCPPGVIWRFPDRMDVIVHDEMDFFLNYNEVRTT